MTLFDVFFGWYAEPSDWHIDWKSGYCIFNHTAGCWVGGGEEDPIDILVQVFRLEGEDLKRFVEEKQDHLELDLAEYFVGVRGCGGEVAFWTSITPGQARALDPEEEV